MSNALDKASMIQRTVVCNGSADMAGQCAHLAMLTSLVRV